MYGDQFCYDLDYCRTQQVVVQRILDLDPSGPPGCTLVQNQGRNEPLVRPRLDRLGSSAAQQTATEPTEALKEGSGLLEGTVIWLGWCMAGATRCHESWGGRGHYVAVTTCVSHVPYM